MPPESPGPIAFPAGSFATSRPVRLEGPRTPSPPRPGPGPAETRVARYFCSSAPNALAGRFVAPVGYRAATGGSPAGDDGPFAIGRLVRLADVKATDGSSFTAGFSERLVGDHQSGHPAAWNYRTFPAHFRRARLARRPTIPVSGAGTQEQAGPGPTTAIPSTITLFP